MVTRWVCGVKQPPKKLDGGGVYIKQNTYTLHGKQFYGVTVDGVEWRYENKVLFELHVSHAIVMTIMCHSEVSIRECFTLGLVCVCVFSVMSRKDTLLRRNVTHQYTICVVSMTSALLLCLLLCDGGRNSWRAGKMVWRRCGCLCNYHSSTLKENRQGKTRWEGLGWMVP